MLICFLVALTGAQERLKSKVDEKIVDVGIRGEMLRVISEPWLLPACDVGEVLITYSPANPLRPCQT